MKMKTQQLKTCEMQQNSSKREVYSKTILPQATKETSSRQPSVTPKTTGKRRTKNTQNQYKERSHKHLNRNK